MVGWVAVTATDIHRTIDAVWRIEAPRLIAGLTRIVRDIALAEDLAHDALVAALEQWPESGVPDNPGAGLMAVGKRPGTDLLRRRGVPERKQAELQHQPSSSGQLEEAGYDSVEADIDDDLLRLMF